ncbi:expressed unknown protein [Seminavis robusta]|uniref:Uncharacterized protein n=1 Tax=Seminavis robusta TaxID=568900 RepID=A0A9N8EN54_9STRA|nr:expressed unknown protein [Seminavis robusta]|eukprot:Sro1510_g278570.1 n/a (469) ;mRNA; f:773-2179
MALPIRKLLLSFLVALIAFCHFANAFQGTCTTSSLSKSTPRPLVVLEVGGYLDSLGGGDNSNHDNQKPPDNAYAPKLPPPDTGSQQLPNQQYAQQQQSMPSYPQQAQPTTMNPYDQQQQYQQQQQDPYGQPQQQQFQQGMNPYGQKQKPRSLSDMISLEDDDDDPMGFFAGQQQQQPMIQQQPNPDDDTQDIDGAVLTEDMKQRAKASHDAPEEEASQGGQLFRSLMARAQERAAQQQIILQQQQQYMQPQQQQQTNADIQIPANAMDLSVEDQARLFREITALRQQGQQQQQQFQQQQFQQQQEHPALSSSYAKIQMPTYPYANPPNPEQKNFLPPGIGFDGRKIGRNRDAEIISTTADVYFAQLKRDSTTRNLARYAGDDDKANAVFHDAGIQEITGPQANPHLADRRANRDQEFVETVPEEMLLFQDYNEKPKDRSYSGVSYKEQIMARRNRRQQQEGNSNNKNH